MMSIAILWSVALASALVAAAPTHDSLSFDLADVMEKSVCPIRVRVDEDANRVPRRIKMLECASTPNPMCEKMTHACCRSHHHKYTTQCVTVTDHVLVRYRHLGDDDKLHKFPVAVGCSCMIQEGTAAVQAQ